jgi:chemotaxis-related protein WspD
VTGDRSCPELEAHIHCRNCPGYARAGLQLLNSALPAQYRVEWAEHYAREKKLSAPGRLSVLVFRLGHEWLALPAQIFQEVAEQRVIHSLPHRRHGLVLGLVNIRGELLICVSLSRLLGLEPEAQRGKARLDPHRLLVAAWEGRRLVFPADEVHGIRRFHPEDLQDPPATVMQAQTGFTHGILRWQDHTVGLLDAGHVFAALNRGFA